MNKRLVCLCAVVAMILGLACESRALTLNPFKRSGRIKATSFIIAGNFVESRLLAELAQYYSKQPILVISPDVDGGDQLFFMPASNNAAPAGPDEFMEIIDHVNPKRIIVLGGEKYVPPKFIDQARSKYSVITLDSDNWSKNAQTLGELLGIRKLQPLFDEFKASIDKTAK